MGGCCATRRESAITSMALNPPSMLKCGGSESNGLKLSPNTFIPRKKIWIIVSNWDYSKARKNESL